LPGTAFQKNLTIALFRTLLHSFVRVYWRPSVRGAVPLPRRGPCFLYGNHANRWDPFILNCFTPWADPTAGVMTQEFFRGRFLAWAMRNVDVHPTRKRIAEPHLIRTIYRMLEAGRKIVIYPEGGSRWTGRPEPWIVSTAKVFVKSEAPVYPVLMHGSYASWPRWATYPRPGRVELEILEPLTFSRKTPLDAALARLQAPLDFDESVTPERLRPRWAFRPACGIHKLLYRDPVTGAPDGVFTPDGTHVVNREGSLRLTMLPDSRLVDAATETIYLPGDLYARIRALPLEPDRDGVLLRNRADLHTEQRFPDLVPRGPVEAVLYEDAVRLTGADVRMTLDLADVAAVDIERNYKLQLFLADQMVQLSFTEDGSALGWKDALLRLQQGHGS
jgi:1-acyl-sn-glycerol-3-phosphate acyltransferase